MDVFEEIYENIDLSNFEGQQQLFWYAKEALLIVLLENPPLKQFSERSNEELHNAVAPVIKRECRLLLCIWKEHDECRSIFKSCSTMIRAMDFLNVVLSDAGLVKGDSSSAYGRITTAALLVRIGELELTGIVDYFKQMSISYFEDCDQIIADEYSKVKKETILNMKKYKKKHVPWAYVKSTDVSKAGSHISIRTLENESGIEFVSSEDIYMMIGIQGEVYFISSEKFEKTYDATDEPLDIFTTMTVFIPEIEVLPDGEHISIDEMAHICYPKNTTSIYAKQLERRAKVFPVYDKENYFLGHKGDFMAVRCDDLSDIYVIKKQIFLQTYEEA